MRTCSLCNQSSPDSASECVHCGADLSEQSTTAEALARLRANPRVGRIRVITARDACPACKAVDGDFPKDEVPDLPVTGCSNPLGCRCFYAPMLTEIYP